MNANSKFSAPSGIAVREKAPLGGSGLIILDIFLLHRVEFKCIIFGSRHGLS